MVDFAVIIVLQILVVLACTECLVAHVPATLRDAMRGNAIRIDGTASERRAAVERAGINWMRRNLYVTLLMVLLPANMFAYVVHTEIIPLSLGLDAMLAFRVSEEGWKDSIRDLGVEDAFDRWQVSQSGDPNSSALRNRKSLIWRHWPVVCLAGLGWLILSAFAIKIAFIRSVRQLATDVEHRSEQYVTHDITRLVDDKLTPLYAAKPR